MELTSGFAGARLVVTPATQAKGLEFDQVVVVEPAAIADAEPAGPYGSYGSYGPHSSYGSHGSYGRENTPGLRRLYVVLTRAVSRLTVLHTHDLPAALT